MSISSFFNRLLRYAVRTYEWWRGLRHYPWSSSPPQRLFAMIANRSRGLPGAHYRAIYFFATAVLKFRERLFLDRVNFAARLTAPAGVGTLRNAALWERDILETGPMVPRPHLNLRVHDLERVQLDRLMSVLLLSESIGSINFFFDDASAIAARTSTSTISEESQRGPGDAVDLNTGVEIKVSDFQGASWSRIFSRHTGFDGAANNYLKVAHAGSLVVALGLPESEDGFCDGSLPEWIAALESFEAPVGNVSFVVLNAVGPAALGANAASAGRPVSFARTVGLSFAETLRVAQQSDVFVGRLDIYGIAALAAQRPGIYLGADTIAGAHAPDVILAPDIAPAQAFAQLKDVLVNTSRRPRRAIEASVLGARRQALPVGDAAGERSAARDKYTLVIPTYNRPGQLLRLLRYLERERADFPIVVLDSSEAEPFANNQAHVAALNLEVRHLQYDPATDPYGKIREGLGNVATPYCSVCADDDILFVPAVRQCVAQLDRRPDAAVCHGWYFNFIEQGSFDLSYVMYRGKSIDDPRPLARLRSLFAAYEALFYGVFRAEVASRAFRDVDKVGTVLGKELVTGAIAAISGKALRLPCIYYGRNTAESLPYSAWHPNQILAYEPALLFAQFPAFRGLLLEALRDMEPGVDQANAAKSIELIFLRYLAPFLRHDMLDLMLDMSMRGEESAAIYRKAWDVFVRMPRAGRPAEPLVDAQGRYAPERLGSARPRDYIASGPTWDGTQRSYRVFYDFIFPHMQPNALIDRDTLVSLLRTLDAY